MSRLDLRASATVCANLGYGGLKFTLRAPRGEMLEYLPGLVEADGDATRGLVLVDAGGHDDPDDKRRHPHGLFTVSSTGEGPCGKAAVCDYLNLPPRFLGFRPDEPLEPLDVTATCEPGLVVLDPVPAGRWVPRRYAADPRVARVARMMAAGDPATVVASRLTPADRRAYDDVLSGRLPVREAPAHVSYLARRSA